MYGRPQPGRRARTASLLREELATKLQEDRDKRKQEAEERRRCLSVGDADMSNPRPSRKIPTRGGTADPMSRRMSVSDPTCLPASTGSQEPAPGTSAAQDNALPTASAAPQPDDQGVSPAQAAFFLAMEARLRSASQKSVDDVSALFQRNIERIDNNTKAIAELKTIGRDNEKKMADMLEVQEARAIAREIDMEGRIKSALERKMEEAAITTRTAVASASVPSVSGAQQDRREAAFHRCRRSLKAWPIQGDDLLDAFKVFLKVKLGLSDPAIAALGPIEVTRRPGKVAEQKLEVLATFESKEDRDAVKAAGPNLAGQADVGLMIHVPGHLLDDLHALNNVGYNIKQKNEGVRRSVKFDDENLSIFMDIKIQGNWKRITPAEARQVANSIPRTAGGGGSRNLSVEDISALVQGEPVAGLNVVEIPEND